MRTIVCMLAVVLAASAQDKQDPKRVELEMTPATRAAIDKGLDLLARRLQRNGSYEGSAPVATSALCGLAFLASGSTYDRGPYSDKIRKCTDFIVKSGGRTGFITEANSGVMGGSGMHGHGFATLFLAEVSGTIGDADVQERVKDALTKAVRNIEGTQNQYGGWNSSPDKNQNDDGSGAVAVMQITAMRAARNAGIEVDKKSVEKAGQYILKITSNDGWTQYNIHNAHGGRGSSALTGAGMAIINALGLHESPKYKKGIANVMSSAPFLSKGQADGGWQSWYHYAAFYCTLAIFQNGGSEWRTWWAGVRDDILKKQSTDGSWAGSYGSYGPLWSAFACLTLEMPYRYLPMYAEGGKGRDGN